MCTRKHAHAAFVDGKVRCRRLRYSAKARGAVEVDEPKLSVVDAHVCWFDVAVRKAKRVEV
jgi:hypothetical protein